MRGTISAFGHNIETGQGNKGNNYWIRGRCNLAPMEQP